MENSLIDKFKLFIEFLSYRYIYLFLIISSPVLVYLTLPKIKSLPESASVVNYISYHINTPQEPIRNFLLISACAIILFFTGITTINHGFKFKKENLPIGILIINLGFMVIGSAVFFLRYFLLLLVSGILFAIFSVFIAGTLINEFSNSKTSRS
ncbi:hypothetical protein [Natroniella sp. ANB-PHB2]|uniref:hypothetical protein n=1 Tax=Natroniella sp. ANB-PHB2 TaxID=3384444 RepID=UPI0038D37920